MKKFALAILLTIITMGLFAEVLITESFDADAFPPTGWTNTALTGTYVWERVTAGTYPVCQPHSGAALIRYNSFSAQTGQGADLSTVSFPAGTGFLYSVSFWMYRDTGYPTSADQVRVYTNGVVGSAGGTLVGTVNRSTTLAPVAPAVGWYNYTFEFAPVAVGGNSYVILNALSAYGNDIYVDDVVISRTASDAPPNPAVIVSPANNATGVLVYSVLNWASGGGGPTDYNVYFGTTATPPFVVNQSTTSYTPTLAINTTYYWQIVPHNANGNATVCPIWTFQTGEDVVLMGNGTQTVANGVSYSFFDSGGATGTYQNSENFTFTFTAASTTAAMQVIFNSFDTEANYDYLKIYDGPNAQSPQIGPALGYNGTTSPGTIIAGNALTFVFTTDSSVTNTGWDATVSAVTLGSLDGTVTCAGAPVPGVAITLSNSTLTQTTSATGTYAFPMVPLGTYQVTAAKVGFTTQTLPAVIVTEQTSILDFNISALPEIAPITMYMNSIYTTGNLDINFDDSARAMTFSVIGNTYLSWTANPDHTITLSPQSGWYGTEYLTIRGTDAGGAYGDKTVRVTVIQTGTTIEDFNHSGSLPTGWTQTHSGTTEFPWQAVLISGTDYNVQTSALTGRTANERLLSSAYNLSIYKDIVVSYDCDFLPYGSGTGTLAYTLNNVTYVTIETLSAAFTGRKTFTLPALDAKPSVKFRWIYANATVNTGQANSWIIDNFQIYGVVKDATLPTPITGLAILSQIGNMATLSWQPTTELYFGSYELYISTDATVTTADRLWSVTNDSDLNNIGHTQTTIDNLATGSYWVAIRAIDQSSNASALSSTLGFTQESIPPVLSNPLPSGQPNPVWSNNRLVTIGCSVTDANLVDLNTIKYRYDRNGNGVYDPNETWTAISRASTSRDSQSITAQVLYETDGTHTFEFQAADQCGNIGYSGTNGNMGISDDWVVRIDSTPPSMTIPVPTEQPNPIWTNSRLITIGCTVTDLNIVDLSSIMYRFDRNGNGIYDPDETWIAFARDALSRDSHTISVQVLYETDGIMAFEFQAADQCGNFGYSGTNGNLGISDDWIVRIDTTPPTLTNPIPTGQPDPVSTDSRLVTIGCSVTDLNQVDIGSIMYRYDRNGNGVYDADEVWIPYTRTSRTNASRDIQNLSVAVLYEASGWVAFEFMSADVFGNIGFSGANGLEGIGDDWVVHILSDPPLFSSPIPFDQPLPMLSNSRLINIGCTITHSSTIDFSSIMYRYDRNGNGSYDATEGWIVLPRSIGRQATRDSYSVSTEVLYESDGTLAFEFKASDYIGNTGYSGTSNLSGISDDWVVRIDTAAPAAITNFFVQNVADNCITLNWTASSDLHFAGYEVYYAFTPAVTTSDLLWNKVNDPALEVAGTGLISTTITALQPATRYYFLLRATDSAGNYVQYPQVINAMTTSSALPSAPENLSIVILSYDIMLDWDDVTTDLNNNSISISSYDVYVGVTPDFECNIDTWVGSATASEYALPGIAEGIDCLFFRVKAVSGAIRQGNGTTLRSQRKL